MRLPGTAGALVLLAPLLLLGAGHTFQATSPSPSPPAPAGGPNPDPAFHDSIAPGYWLPLLDAPQAPGDFRPGTGLPLLRPTQGVETQPFGCTDFGR